MTKKIITTLFASLIFAAAINAQQKQTAPNGASVRSGGSSNTLVEYTKQVEAKIAAEKKTTFEKQQQKIAEMNRLRQENASNKAAQVNNNSKPQTVKPSTTGGTREVKTETKVTPVQKDVRTTTTTQPVKSNDAEIRAAERNRSNNNAKGPGQK